MSDYRGLIEEMEANRISSKELQVPLSETNVISRKDIGINGIAVLRYPVNTILELPDGTVLSAKDHAREIMNAIVFGGGVAIPQAQGWDFKVEGGWPEDVKLLKDAKRGLDLLLCCSLPNDCSGQNMVNEARETRARIEAYLMKPFLESNSAKEIRTQEETSQEENPR